MLKKFDKYNINIGSFLGSVGDPLPSMSTMSVSCGALLVCMLHLWSVEEETSTFVAAVVRCVGVVLFS